MAKHKFETGVNPLDEIKDKILKRDIPGARFLEIERIKVEEQVRKTFLEESIKELADSISEVGLISPLTVKKIDGDPDNFLLIAGERRLKALKLLGETKAQVIVREIRDDQIELVQLIENLHRENVPPLELAAGYKLLQDKFNLSNVGIAKKIGKTEGHVRQIIKILSLPENLQEQIRNGYEVSKTLEISKLDKKTQKEVLKNIDNFSREDIKKLNETEHYDNLDITHRNGYEVSNADKSSTFDLKTENQEPQIPGTPPYEQIRNLMPGETTKALIDNFYGETPNTEDHEQETIDTEVDTAEQENPTPENQNPDIDEIIKEFNSSTENIRIKNIGFQAISIWSANPQTLIDIVYELKIWKKRR